MGRIRNHSDNAMGARSYSKSKPEQRRIHVHVEVQKTNEISLRQIAGEVVRETKDKAIDYYMLYEKIDPSISEKVSSLSDLFFLKQALNQTDVSIYEKDNKKVLAIKDVCYGSFIYLFDANIMIAAAFKYPDYAEEIFAFAFALGNEMHLERISDFANCDLDSATQENYDEDSIDSAKRIVVAEDLFSSLRSVFCEKVNIRALLSRWVNYKSDRYHEYEKDEKKRWSHPHENEELFLLFQYTAKTILHWIKIDLFGHKEINVIDPNESNFDEEGLSEWHHAYIDIFDYGTWLGEMLDSSWQCFGAAAYHQVVCLLEEHYKHSISINYDEEQNNFEKLIFKWEKLLTSESYMTQAKTLLKSMVCLESYTVNMRRLEKMVDRVTKNQFSASLVMNTEE